MTSLKQADLKGKKAILRVDYNVPFRGLKIEDNERITQTLPTLKFLLNSGAAVIIISHLGRPGGKSSQKFSLEPVAKELEKLIQEKVLFTYDIVGEEAKKAALALKPGEILMLENLRTDPREELNDIAFAEAISQLGDVFVQDAFANAHRQHASMVGISKFLPAYPGLLFEKEYQFLSQLLIDPKKPFLVIVGGKKIETKLSLLKKIIEKADIVIVGGGIANTLIAAEGYDLGKSYYQEEFLTEAEDILREARDRGVEVLMPDDVVVAKTISESAKITNKSLEEIKENDVIVDIGPQTITKYSEPIKFAGTVFWNGPMGITEFDKFSSGTRAIAKLVSNSETLSIVGGGDTIAAVKARSSHEHFDYITTGGGAALEFLSGEKMPAIEVLLEKGGIS